MASIEAGLPEVKKETTTSRRDVLFEEIAKKQDWICVTCKSKNDKAKHQCGTCGQIRILPKPPTDKPKTVIASKVTSTTNKTTGPAKPAKKKWGVI